MSVFLSVFLTDCRINPQWPWSTLKVSSAIFVYILSFLRYNPPFRPFTHANLVWSSRKDVSMEPAVWRFASKPGVCGLRLVKTAWATCMVRACDGRTDRQTAFYSIAECDRNRVKSHTDISDEGFVYSSVVNRQVRWLNGHRHANRHRCNVLPTTSAENKYTLRHRSSAQLHYDPETLMTWFRYPNRVIKKALVVLHSATLHPAQEEYDRIYWPWNAGGLHTVSQCDVIGPDVELPFAKSQHSAVDTSAVNTNTHVEYVHSGDVTRLSTSGVVTSHGRPLWIPTRMLSTSTPVTSRTSLPSKVFPVFRH